MLNVPVYGTDRKHRHNSTVYIRAYPFTMQMASDTTKPSLGRKIRQPEAIRNPNSLQIHYHKDVWIHLENRLLEELIK